MFYYYHEGSFKLNSKNIIQKVFWILYIFWFLKKIIKYFLCFQDGNSSKALEEIIFSCKHLYSGSLECNEPYNVVGARFVSQYF